MVLSGMVVKLPPTVSVLVCATGDEQVPLPSSLGTERQMLTEGRGGSWLLQQNDIYVNDSDFLV